MAILVKKIPTFSFMKKNRNQIAILGGGVAGLSAAWKLSEHNTQITVLEREKEVGGLSRTSKFKGFRFDYSAHRFNSNNPEVIRRFKKLLGKHLLKKEKKTYIVHWGKYLTYPPKAFEVAKAMPKFLLIRATIDIFWSQISNLFKKKKNKSFTDWTRSRFGKTLSSHLNEKYAEKIWKTPPDKLSGDWASFRVGEFKLIRFILSLFLKHINLYKNQNHPDTDWFYYSDIGIGLFPQQMSKQIIKNGCKVSLNSLVYKIVRKGKKYEVFYTKSGKRMKLQADRIISTIPLDILIRSLVPHAPEKVQKAMSKLEYLCVLVVNILLKKRSVNNATWIYYPEQNTIFNYILEFKNWSKKMAPKDKTSLSANITCRLGDNIWKMKDKELIKKTVSDLVRVGLIKKEQAYSGFVERLPYAYPVYKIGYSHHLHVIKHYISKLPNFYMTGRTGNYDYINSDQAFEGGLRTAEKILPLLTDIKK